MVKAKKCLGQHFLQDRSVIDKMINELSIQSGDTVVEIGPGEGQLTYPIAEKLTDMVFDFHVIEIDYDLVKPLKAAFASKEHIHVYHQSILDFFDEQQELLAKPYKIIGSLPYYITSMILKSLFKLPTLPERAIFMVQKEYAQKLMSGVPDANLYSSLFQSLFSIKKVCDVPAGKFDPTPEVDSAVVRLELNPDALSQLTDRGEQPDNLLKFYKFIKHAYLNPRKMLNKAFSPELLSLASLDAQLRPQNVTTSDWLRLFPLYLQEISN